jgi:hypothetical protein
MKRRGGLLIAGGLVASILGPSCAPEELEPQVTVTVPDPQHIADDASTEVTITVVDANGEKGTGVVRLTTKVGMFGDEGNNTLAPLVDGTATTSFTCPVAKDPNCSRGVSSISADWRGNLGSAKVYVGERGLQLLSGKTGSGASPTIPTVDPNATGSLTGFSSGQVYLYGSLQRDEFSISYSALSSLSQPMRLFVGLPGGKPLLRPDGRLVYMDDRKVYLAAADEFTADSTSTRALYPQNAIGNDTLVPTSKCPGDATSIKLHPASGEVFYACNSTDTYYTQGGLPVVPAPYALIKMGFSSYKLVGDRSTSTADIYILDGANKPVRVDQRSNPDTDYMHWSTARAKGDGFQMVYADGPVRQLWKLTNKGVWSRVANYPSRLPTGYSVVSSYYLDSFGTAYAHVRGADGTQAVARFSQNAAEAFIVYSEKYRPPDSGWNIWPPRLYNMISGGSLLTGP